MKRNFNKNRYLYGDCLWLCVHAKSKYSDYCWKIYLKLTFKLLKSTIDCLDGDNRGNTSTRHSWLSSEVQSV